MTGASPHAMALAQCIRDLPKRRQKHPGWPWTPSEASRELGRLSEVSKGNGTKPATADYALTFGHAPGGEGIDAWGASRRLFDLDCHAHLLLHREQAWPNGLQRCPAYAETIRQLYGNYTEGSGFVSFSCVSVWSSFCHHHV